MVGTQDDFDRRSTTVPDELLTPAELSAETKVPERTLAQWRYLGQGPAYLKLGGHLRYPRSGVDRWKADNLRSVG
jgi:hypothetical protein